MADVSGKFFSAKKVRTGVSPSSPGIEVGETLPPVNPPGGALNSVGLTMPSAFNVANSPLTSNGSLDVTGAGTISQYIRGDGTLETFPSLTGYVPYTGATQNVDLGEFGVDAGFVNLDTTPTGTPTTQGTIYWDDARSTAALIMNGTIQHIGQDSFFYVKNSTGSSINKGVAVRFDGTDGGSGHLKIAPFIADGTYPSTYFMGVTADTIGNGEFGQVMHFGELEGINTSGFTAGDLLYASTTVAGGFQTTAPVAPNNIVLIGAAINSKNNGAILVRPTYGSNINNDEGVKITTPTTGQLLQLQAGGLWENKTIAQVLGGTSSQFVKGDGSLDSTTYQNTADKGQPNGYASLDGNGKVPLTQINDALIGNVIFQGLWNASTNTPTLVDPPSSGTKGYYYIVSTGGTFAGITFEVGDWIISNGTAWGKVDNTDAVSSVFGRTGNVTASNGDYNTSQVTESGNLYYTDARSRAALSFVAGSGAYNSSTGVITIPTNNNQITNGAGYITSAALSGYLPLTGGTLTGALNGTSASFSSLLTANSIKIESTSAPAFLYFNNTSAPASNYIALGSGANELYFHVNGTDRMLITDSGKVGIGTDLPATTLEVNGVGLFTGTSLTGNTKAGLYIFDSRIISLNGGGARDLNIESQNLIISTGVSYGESMRVFSSRNVHIGPTPSSDNGAKLQVSGTATVSGLLSVMSHFAIYSDSEFMGALGFNRNPATGAIYNNSRAAFQLQNNLGTFQFRAFSSAGSDLGTPLSISSTGAATFSSSVTANGISSIGQEQAFTWQRTTGTASDIYSLNADSGSAYLYNNTTANILMMWSEGGNVGIGTSPVVKFQINDGTNINLGIKVGQTDSTAVMLNAFNDGAAANIPLEFRATKFGFQLGKVGIGTDSPEGKLTIEGTSAQPPTSGTTANSLLQLKGSLNNELNLGSNTVAGNYGAYIQASDNNLAVPYQLNLQPTGGNVIIGSYTDNGAKLQVSGTTSINGGLNSYHVVSIKSNNTLTYGGLGVYSSSNDRFINIQHTGTEGFVETENAGSGVMTPLSFKTGGATRIHITSSGNVGIGTTSPRTGEGTPLTIESSTGYVGISLSGTGSYANVWQLYVSGDGASNKFFGIYDRTNNAYRLVTTAAGSVLIGTTNDSGSSQPLQVVKGGSSNYLRLQVDNNAGFDSALFFTDGTNSVYAGMMRGSSGLTGAYTIWTGGAARVNVNSSGNVLIGTTTDSGQKMQVYSSGTTRVRIDGAGNNSGVLLAESGTSQWSLASVGGTLLFYNEPTGNTRFSLTSSGVATFVNSVTATSFFESSDASLKTLVEDNYQAKGIDSVVAKLYIKNGKEELGYYAQDLQGVLPSAVSKGSDGLLNLSYREVHTAKIAYLEEKIKQLENELGRISK
jgi:hypothetical protein